MGKSLMLQLFTTDAVRKLNKSNLKNKLEREELKSNEYQTRDADVRNKGSHYSYWRCCTGF